VGGDIGSVNVVDFCHYFSEEVDKMLISVLNLLFFYGYKEFIIFVGSLKKPHKIFVSLTKLWWTKQ
jgi:hypothetical protein